MIKNIMKSYLAGLDGYPKEMCEQIMYGTTESNDSGLVAMMSWGVSNFQGMPEEKDFRAALRFHVQGAKYQGEVTIKLTWMDDYDIYFGEERVIERIYCGELTEVLDNRIER